MNFSVGWLPMVLCAGNFGMGSFIGFGRKPPCCENATARADVRQLEVHRPFGPAWRSNDSSTDSRVSQTRGSDSRRLGDGSQGVRDQFELNIAIIGVVSLESQVGWFVGGDATVGLIFPFILTSFSES